jgi:hypothetical protein
MVPLVVTWSTLHRAGHAYAANPEVPGQLGVDYNAAMRQRQQRALPTGLYSGAR